MKWTNTKATLPRQWQPSVIMAILADMPSWFRIILVTLGDSGFLLVAAMDVESVTKGHALAGGYLQVASAGGFLFKIMETERIRGEQTVIPHVPPGGMPGVLRVVEDRDTDDLSVHWTVVIAPGGALAPGFSVPHALAVHDVAGRFAFVEFVRPEPHRFVEPHCHHPFFRVAKGHIAVRCVDGDLEIEQALVAAIVDAEHAVVGSYDFSVPGDVLVF